MLLTIVENGVDVLRRLPTPPISTATIIDGMALVQMRKAAGSKTFGEMVYCKEMVASELMLCLTSTGKNPLKCICVNLFC